MNHVRKTVTVVGASSDTGRAVTGALEAAGHEVRPVSRHHGVSLDDARAMGSRAPELRSPA